MSSGYPQKNGSILAGVDWKFKRAFNCACL